MTEDPKATGSLESREAVVATVDLTRVTRCLKALALQLLDSAGARPLVASKAGPAHSCAKHSSFGQSKLPTPELYTSIYSIIITAGVTDTGR